MNNFQTVYTNYFPLLPHQTNCNSHCKKLSFDRKKEHNEEEKQVYSPNIYVVINNLLIRVI